MLSFPLQCFIVINLDATFSLTRFSLICMCLIDFIVKDFDQSTQPALSLNIGVVGWRKYSAISRSCRMFRMCRISLTASLVAYISDSVVLAVVIVYLFEFQCINSFTYIA